MQPSIPYEGSLLSVMEDGGREGYSHTIGVLYVNTLHQNSAPNLPLSPPSVGWANSGTEARGKCLRMLHSILCALNRRQSTTQVRLSEGRMEGCILVPSIEGGMGRILQQRSGIYGKWDPSTLNIIDLNMSSFVPSTLSRSRAPPLKEGSTSA